MVRNRQSPILINLIEKYSCKRIAEIGVWKGHTTRNILRALGSTIESYWAIDAWKVTGPGKGRQSAVSEEDWEGLYKRLCLDMFHFPNLKVLKMTSLEAAAIFPKSYFDLVFIDADHGYESVKADINTWFPLMKKTGVLTGHDYSSRRNPGVKKAVNEIFGEQNITRVEIADMWIYLIGGEDGRERRAMDYS